MMRARWCTNGVPSIFAPNVRSQNNRQGLAGFGVQMQKTNQQNSQSNMRKRAPADQGEANCDPCAGLTVSKGSAIQIALAFNCRRAPANSRNHPDNAAPHAPGKIQQLSRAPPRRFVKAPARRAGGPQSAGRRVFPGRVRHDDRK